MRAELAAADEAAFFVRLLMEACRSPESDLYVVVTVRAEFLGECFRFYDLPEVLSKGLYLVPRMTREARRAAIEGPAEYAGMAIAPNLIQTLLNLDEGPDTLSVLQHTLHRIWMYAESMGTAPIDTSHFEGVGGSEALDRHGDEIVARLNPEEHRIAERMLVRLTEEDAGGRVFRRVASIKELSAISAANDQTVRNVLRLFEDAELVLSSGDLFGLVHELIIRRWNRLRHWTSEEKKNAELYRNLLFLAEKGSVTLPGGLLEEALRWQAKAEPNAAWAERYGGNFQSVITLIEQSRRAQRHWKYWFGS